MGAQGGAERGEYVSRCGEEKIGEAAVEAVEGQRAEIGAVKVGWEEGLWDAGPDEIEEIGEAGQEIRGALAETVGIAG